jgi:hypothetical protein
MAPGFEDAQKLAQTKASSDYWAKSTPRSEKVA